MSMWEYGRLSVPHPISAGSMIFGLAQPTFTSGTYKREFSSEDEALYVLGGEGWEIVSHAEASGDSNWTYTTYTFKRSEEQAAIARQRQRQKEERYRQEQASRTSLNQQKQTQTSIQSVRVESEQESRVWSRVRGTSLAFLLSITCGVASLLFYAANHKTLAPSTMHNVSVGGPILSCVLSIYIMNKTGSKGWVGFVALIFVALIIGFYGFVFGIVATGYVYELLGIPF